MLQYQRISCVFTAGWSEGLSRALYLILLFSGSSCCVQGFEWSSRVPGGDTAETQHGDGWALLLQEVHPSGCSHSNCHYSPPHRSCCCSWWFLIHSSLRSHSLTPLTCLLLGQVKVRDWGSWNALFLSLKTSFLQESASCPEVRVKRRLLSTSMPWISPLCLSLGNWPFPMGEPCKPLPWLRG